MIVRLVMQLCHVCAKLLLVQRFGCYFSSRIRYVLVQFVLSTLLLFSINWLHMFLIVKNDGKSVVAPAKFLQKLAAIP